MGRECKVSGKKTSFGNSITSRGKAKYLGGVGTKCTGVSRRVFRPNLQRRIRTLRRFSWRSPSAAVAVWCAFTPTTR